MRSILPVTRALERLGIPYVVGGALAGSVYGVPRLTLEAEMLADMQLEQAPQLMEALSKGFEVEAGMMEAAIVQEGRFGLVEHETALRLDIYIRRSRPFDRMQLSRRRAAVIGTEADESIYVTSPEDTILAHLERYRLGGEVSDDVWQGAVGMLKSHAEVLDRSYLRQWARELKVGRLLERAGKEAELL